MLSIRKVVHCYPNCYSFSLYSSLLFLFLLILPVFSLFTISLLSSLFFFHYLLFFLYPLITITCLLSITHYSLPTNPYSLPTNPYSLLTIFSFNHFFSLFSFHSSLPLTFPLWCCRVCGRVVPQWGVLPFRNDSRGRCRQCISLSRNGLQRRRLLR